MWFSSGEQAFKQWRMLLANLETGHVNYSKNLGFGTLPDWNKVTFGLNYSGLLSAVISPFVGKEFVVNRQRVMNRKKP